MQAAFFQHVGKRVESLQALNLQPLTQNEAQQDLELDVTKM